MAGYVIDYSLDIVQGVTESSFDTNRIYIDIPDMNKTGSYCLRDARIIYEKTMVDAVFDFEGFIENKPIRTCSFMEFLKIYGTFVLKLSK